jgi:hypothetical protein
MIVLSPSTFDANRDSVAACISHRRVLSPTKLHWMGLSWDCRDMCWLIFYGILKGNFGKPLGMWSILMKTLVNRKVYEYKEPIQDTGVQFCAEFSISIHMPFAHRGSGQPPAWCWTTPHCSHNQPPAHQWIMCSSLLRGATPSPAVFMAFGRGWGIGS